VAASPRAPEPIAQAVVIGVAVDAGTPALLFTHDEAVERVSTLCEGRQERAEEVQKPWLEEDSDGDTSCDVPDAVTVAIDRASKALGRNVSINSVGCEHVFGRRVVLDQESGETILARWTPKGRLEKHDALTRWEEFDVDGDSVLEPIKIKTLDAADELNRYEVQWANGSVLRADLQGTFRNYKVNGKNLLVLGRYPARIHIAREDVRVLTATPQGVQDHPADVVSLIDAMRPAREVFPPICHVPDSCGLNMTEQILLLNESPERATGLARGLCEKPLETPDPNAAEPDSPTAPEPSTEFALLWPAAVGKCPLPTNRERLEADAKRESIARANARNELLTRVEIAYGCASGGRIVAQVDATAHGTDNQDRVSRSLQHLEGETVRRTHSQVVVGQAAELPTQLDVSGDWRGSGNAETLIRTGLLLKSLEGKATYKLADDWLGAVGRAVRLPKDDRDSVLFTNPNDATDVLIVRLLGSNFQKVPKTRYQGLLATLLKQYTASQAQHP
jgi:hypothetical protein